MNNKIKLVLIDDHDIVRDGINALLMMEDDIDVIGEASNANELYSLLNHLKPNILLLDILMPGKSGIEIAIDINLNYPDIKIIILSSDLNENSIFKAIRAGINGYLPKNVKKDELIKAIRQVNSNRDYYSDAIPTTIFRIFKDFAQAGKNNKFESAIILTEREKEIIRCFAESLSYKEIAAKLFISARTVESHKNNIMEKLECKTMVDLIKYAIRNGYC